MTRSPTAPNNPWAAESDVELTPELISQFEQDLRSRAIVIDTISGPWGNEFVSSLPFSHSSNPLVLASETIYSPDTLRSFVSVLDQTVRSKRALIAAKKVYFGVGGGVDEFVREWERIGGGTKLVMEVGDQGVARVVLEVFRR